MKRIFTLVLSVALCLLLGACGETTTPLEEFLHEMNNSKKTTPIEDFEYEMNNGEIIITGYKGVDLEIYIPEEINKRPVTIIGEKAFEGYDMTHITLPDSVKEIRENAFSECECLETVGFSKNLELIGNYAFYSCIALKEVKLPEKIKRINHAAFHSCETLENIEFPENIEAIGESAFKNCSALSEITLPKNLKGLEADAFACCDSLGSLRIPDNTELTVGTFRRSVGYVGYMIEFRSPVGGSSVTYYSESHQYAQGDTSFEELSTILIVSEGSSAHKQLKGYERYGLKFKVQ